MVLTNKQFTPTRQANKDITQDLIQVVRKEAQALELLIKAFPIQASSLVQSLATLQGSVFFTGMGKSGLIGQKLASTFSSFGMPSFFLHPSEALHGDIGRVQQADHCIVLSKSASGKELEQLVQALRSQQVPTTLICCNKGALAQSVDETILLPFESEACHLNVAPTSSSTLMLAFGDALAVVTSKLRGFTSKDFAKLHPSGALGNTLLLTVRALMHSGSSSLPLLTSTSSFQEMLTIITEKKLGVGIVVDSSKRLCGIITDGDVRRAIERGPDVFSCTAHELMTADPKVISPQAMAYDALKIMEDYNITTLVVAQDEQVVGLVHIHDLVKAGISL